MKTKPHTTHLLAFVIALAAALVAQVASAVSVNNSVDITETSSTSLSVLYNGSALPASDITFDGPNHWTVALPVVFNALPGVTLSLIQWVEPGNSALVNQEVPGGVTATNNFDVFSDVSPNTTFPTNPDGTGVEMGLDQNMVPIIATFHDVGDTVPDTGSTLGLLSLALAALFGASRFRALRLA